MQIATEFLGGICITNTTEIGRHVGIPVTLGHSILIPFGLIHFEKSSNIMGRNEKLCVHF